MKKVKVLSLFSGIGAFEKALDKLEMPYDLVAYCEIDKYAAKSYSAIHGVDESMNLGDITKVDEKALPKDIDLVTYGFPCQDISLAGKQKGLFNEDGSQTRSGLFFEALRIIEETQPRVAIAENVKNLTSKKFSEQFKIVLESLNEAGYNNYWQVLNAKDYGIPQNRERVFIVSIRKDIDTGMFQFPQGFPLEIGLKDLLEDEVDEKFYLSETGKALFKKHDKTRVNRTTENDADVTILTLAHGFDTGCEKDATIFPTLTTRTCTNWHAVLKENKQPTVLQIRKLTPKECFRLMGFDDADLAKAEAVNSNSQLYKQAGNGVTVNVIYEIAKKL